MWVSLQRQEKKHLELKSAIAYEGWEGGDDSYRLVGKRLYCHGLVQTPFWEGASVAFDRHWDLSQVRRVVVGGDGASWIDEGAQLFPEAVRQLDGFHLARGCTRRSGRETGSRRTGKCCPCQPRTRQRHARPCPGSCPLSVSARAWTGACRWEGRLMERAVWEQWQAT